MKAIKVIESYANDSIEYGKRSGNAKALKRGTDVIYALNSIKDELKDYQQLNSLIVANQSSLLEVESIFARKIDPGNYKNLEDWKAACQQLRNDL